MLFPVPPQYDRTHPTFGRPAGKSGCYQSRTVAQRRLYDAAQRAPFTQQSCIELQDYVRQFGIQDKSLQKIYAILFKEKISKSQRLSNWEADVLSDGQKQYAATDAWACLNIYNLLQELKRTGNYEVESLPVEEEVDANAPANR